MKKAGGEQTPPLMCAYGERAEVTAPVRHVERRRLGEGDAACHHGGKDQNVDPNQGVGDGIGTAGAGRAGLPGEGLGGGVVHVSTVLTLPGFGTGMGGG